MMTAIVMITAAADYDDYDDDDSDACDETTAIWELFYK